MKKRLLQFLTVFSAFVSYNAVHAQTYEHLQVTSGYTADVIANGPGSALNSSTIGVDNADICFMSNDFQPTAAPPPAYALPSTGLITSNVTPGLSFQLGPLSGNNSLRAQNQNTGGTLAFSNGVQASRLYVLATSGSGSATMTVTVNFTDATSQVVTGVVVPDWFFSNALPVASSGFGRVYRNTNVIENPTGDPRLYQYALEVSPANQLKTIASMQFTKTSSAEGALNVFAVTAELVGTCPSPGGLTAVATATTATLSWTPAVIVPSGGYDYYYSTVSTPPTDATVPSGNVGSGENSVDISNLNTGLPYYAWVRSNCGDTDKGPWVMVTFTPGQISGTYTSGDISTLYMTSEPTTTSSTTCPGTMTINVPAGYQIASVSTAYTMTTASNGWMSEQRSLLVCTTTNTTEASVSAGVGNNGGTMTYSRTGLTLANGATGAVQFQLRAWRMYGGSGCNTTYNRVDNNSWTVTVTYAPLSCVAPPDPVASAQALCSGATVADLEATGETGASFNWYSGATGGTALAPTTVLSSTTYYVSQIVDACESNRVPVTVTVNTVAAPTAEAQSFCSAATVAELEATGVSGAEFNWYAGSTGGEELPGTAALSSATYYVSQTVGDCESARTPVTVMVTNLATPTAEAQGVCPGSTVSDLEAEGEAGAVFNWYDAPSGGSPLDGTTVLAAGTYYVSQTVGDCESARQEVAVTVNATPVPEIDENPVGCYGITVADATEGSDDYHIYTSQTGGDALAGEVLLTTGTYYVSQTINGCESERVAVDVTIIDLDEPAIEDNQQFCEGATLASIEVDYMEGADLDWYATMGGDLLPDATLLTDGMTYYAVQHMGECESGASEITVTVHPTPEIPGGMDVQDFISGETIASLEITTEAAATVTWYMLDESSDFVVVDTDTALEDGAVYYVTQSVGGCESGFLTIEANEVLSSESFGFKNLMVYPNPASDVLNISNDEAISRITITNLLGQKVMDLDGNSTGIQVNVSQLPQGNYILQVYSGSGTASVKIARQ